MKKHVLWQDSHQCYKKTSIMKNWLPAITSSSPWQVSHVWIPVIAIIDGIQHLSKDSLQLLKMVLSKPTKPSMLIKLAFKDRNVSYTLRNLHN